MFRSHKTAPIARPRHSIVGLVAVSLVSACTAVLSCGAAALAAEVTELGGNELVQYAIASYKRGDYNSAMRYLEARVRKTPEDADAYYYLGNCYLQQKRHADAAKMYAACVRVAPASPAGQFALKALEGISSMPKADAQQKAEPAADKPDAKLVEASHDALLTDKPIDKSMNEAMRRIKSHRQTFKEKINRVWDQVQDDLLNLSPRNNPNYAADLERIRREAENKVENLQTAQLRFEARMIAPDKIDVRAVPKVPEEKPDNTKVALGSLMEYIKPEKVFDPFDTELKPEVTDKFLSIRDVFGELSTYQPSARSLCKQVFMQLKRGVETKQDSLDQQIFQVKANLIRDIVQIKSSYGNANPYRQFTAQQQLSSIKIPRKDQANDTPMDVEISQASERAKRRIKDLEENYNRAVDGLIVGAKERLGAMIAQAGHMNSQLKHGSGTIQMVPLGTNVYTRNYVNFGDRPTEVRPLMAVPQKMPASAASSASKNSASKNSASKRRAK